MKRFISILLSALMLVTSTVALSSCGGDDENSKAEKTVLTMATNANFPPYEYMEGDEFAGIDVEIAQKLADKLGMTLKIENVEFGSIIGGVSTGKYDMGIAGMTVTDERKQSVNFTQTYATGIQSIIVKYDANYNSLDDFYNMDEEGNYISVKEGVKIAVQQDTTGDIYASDTVEKFGFGEENILRFKNGADAVQALETGKCAAVIIDDAPAKSFVAASIGLRILDGAYTNEDYAICVKKENTELLEKLNKALDELKADGTIDSIIKKYIPADSTTSAAE